ncbi:MAG: M6 family metalloprotease domain-containing protein [Muribaculaceae bacterium]|nr:M6 family metalloprotease domain-containing protein [Muribaculaceae bacterium]
MNLKQLSLCALAALSGLSMLAVPAKQGLRTVSQPDSSTIKVRLVGDEFYHTYVTEDGQAVERDADGYFRARGTESLRAAKSRATARRTAAEKPRKATQVPVTGSPRVPVLLLQYSDVKFKDADPKATFTKFFEEGNESARQYFIDQSNGKYTPQFDIYGPYTLSGKRATYGGNDYWGNDMGVGNMVGQGCQGLSSQIDFSTYDNDGDRECDVVIVIYAGVGEASSGEEDAVWPMQWSLSSSEFGKALSLNGTRVDKFAVFNELNGTNNNKIDGIGTFCHEFSHCLGLPDFYDTQYNGHFGMGDWSLMDNGCYNNDGYTPIGYSAYEKEFMNWIEIPEVTANTYYTLPVMNQKDIATDKAIRVTSDKDKNEYYIIENRACQGWDSYLRAEGLLISHVTYSASAWANNEVNDHALQRMTPIPADNRLKLDVESYMGQTYYFINEEDEKGDLWPYGSATELTDTSKPAAALNSGTRMGKPITEMTRNADGTISFWAMKAPKAAVATPVAVAHSVPSTSSLTLSWQAGDENAVTYSIEVKEHKDINAELVFDTDFTNENHAWTTGDYTNVEPEQGGIRLGSGNRLGSITSPAFLSDENGQVTVFVNAKFYSETDASSIKVSITNANGVEQASKTIALSGDYTDYTVLLDGTGSDYTKVKIETTAKKKRAFIASAKVYTGDATALAASRAVESGDASLRTITGITGTSYTVTGLNEGASYDYRIKAVPVDADNFDSSPWTSYVNVDLSDLSGISTITADTDAEPEYYTLQGHRVSADALTPGIYIVRRGAKVEKTVVR